MSECKVVLEYKDGRVHFQAVSGTVREQYAMISVAKELWMRNLLEGFVLNNPDAKRTFKEEEENE